MQLQFKNCCFINTNIATHTGLLRSARPMGSPGTDTAPRSGTWGWAVTLQGEIVRFVAWQNSNTHRQIAVCVEQSRQPPPAAQSIEAMRVRCARKVTTSTPHTPLDSQPKPDRRTHPKPPPLRACPQTTIPVHCLRPASHACVHWPTHPPVS